MGGFVLLFSFFIKFPTHSQRILRDGLMMPLSKRGKALFTIPQSQSSVLPSGVSRATVEKTYASQMIPRGTDRVARNVCVNVASIGR